MIAKFNAPNDPSSGGNGDGNNASPDNNRGTLIPNATYALQPIESPLYVNLLNEVSENPEDIKKQLQYVKRGLGYIDVFTEEEDIKFTEKQLGRINTIRELFEHQDYMYRNNAHSVKDRIASISQPYIRPIICG